MNKWIKITDKNPQTEGVYKTLHIGYRWEIEEISLHYSFKNGFQPIGINEYPIEMHVTHWLYVEKPEPPIAEAYSMIINTQRFFCDDIEILKSLLKRKNINIYSSTNNSVEVDLDGIDKHTLALLNASFPHNEISKVVKKS